MDLTKEWFVEVRRLRKQSGLSVGEGRGLSATAAAEAAGGSRWRAPLTPFMQQATELNCSIREMHLFLLEHFLDYVDLYESLPSKRSLMTEGEKDMIDLEVTSFMTACAAGVDALKALLQRERLRRIEQEVVAARAVEEDGEGREDGLFGGGAGADLLPGSRPAHEHTAVTFLFERLRVVTEVAETMQSERHQRTAAKKSRFYGGPAVSRREAANGGNDGDAKVHSAAAKGAWWKPTVEELEEERLLQEMLPGVYGQAPGREAPVNPDDSQKGDALPTTQSSTLGTVWRRESSGISPTVDAGGRAAATVAATNDEGRERRPVHEDPPRRAPGGPGVVAGIPGPMRRWGGRGRTTVSSALAAVADEETVNDGLVPSAVLEGENRDLVARLKNELDEARQVETKMTEISSLMGLFASKVVEQQGGMEHVFDAAVLTNDNLVRGGKHLEKAVERGAAFRLFYAWFMLGASFCLLFLHFFNT